MVVLCAVVVFGGGEGRGACAAASGSPPPSLPTEMMRVLLGAQLRTKNRSAFESET